MPRKALGFSALLVFKIILLSALLLFAFTDLKQLAASEIEVTGDVEGLQLEADTPLFDMTNMKPGDSDEASVTLKNQSENDLLFSFSSDLEDGDRTLLQGLEMELQGEDGTTYFNQTMDKLYDVKITSLPAGEEKELALKVRFPREAGNQFQGKTASVNFVFGATRDRIPVPPDPPVPPPAPPVEVPVFIKTIGEEDPPEGGTVSGEGIFWEEEEVELEAEAHHGYEFVYWLEGKDHLLSLDPEYRFEATRDRHITGRFWEVTDKTEIKEIEVNDQGEGSVSLPGAELKFEDADPGDKAVLALTPYDKHGEEPPEDSHPADLYYQLKVSENLEGSPAVLYLDYEEVLPEPDDFSEEELKLFNWNEALERWDFSDLDSQELLIETDELDLHVEERALRAEIEKLGHDDEYGIFYAEDVEPVPGFLTNYLFWLCLLAFILGLTAGYVYMHRVKS